MVLIKVLFHLGQIGPDTHLSSFWLTRKALPINGTLPKYYLIISPACTDNFLPTLPRWQKVIVISSASRWQLGVIYLHSGLTMVYLSLLWASEGICLLSYLDSGGPWRLSQDSTQDILGSFTKPWRLMHTLIIRSSSSRSMQPLPSIS